jgi:cation-transporting ATPase E
LKQADLGIAMGSGSGATRAVAQLVLLDNRFAVMPHVVAEGRRVLGNIERVADVFLTKTFYAIVISLLTGLTALAFPFLPRHLTLISALTIGIPGFFLALMPNTERFRPGFFRRVLIFTIPCGVIAALSAMTSYYLALRVDQPEEQARTAATITLFCVAIAVLTQSARPLNPLRIGIVVAMIAGFVAVFAIPFAATFFDLHADLDAGTGVAVGIGAVGAVLVGVTTVITDRWRRA